MLKNTENRSVKLSDLLELPAEYDRKICGLTLDSRQAGPGDVFLACRGTCRDGREFIPRALAAGVEAVLEEGEEFSVRLIQGKPCICYPHLSRRAGELASAFYGHPSRAMRVAGVTGTNGKTSIAHFLAGLLPQPCGVLGTAGYGLHGSLAPGGLTTPDPISLHAHLAAMRRAGAGHVCMEVSSHALDQDRVAGVCFDTAIFSNLSRDHLDYHGDMAHYAAAKRKLFAWPGLRRAVLNLDHPLGREWFESLPAGLEKIGYSLERNSAPVHVRDLTARDGGYGMWLVTPWGEGELTTSLLGAFNVSNLLAALAAALGMGQPLDSLLAGAANLPAVAGRMERFARAGSPLLVVDYAHTPDALEQALTALRAHCRGALWCVFGCGGQRDQGKRPLMGGVAERLADRVIVTDDNPRNEAPEQIIREILEGMKRPEQALTLSPRAEAITYAFCEAEQQDVILLAGKGAETSQQVGQNYLPHSDRELAARLVNGKLGL